MELEKLSFLGPFFGLSVFADDNVSVCACALACILMYIIIIINLYSTKSCMADRCTVQEIY